MTTNTTDIPQGARKFYGRVRGKTSNIVNDHLILVMLGPALLAILIVFIYPVATLFYKSFFLTGGVAIGGSPKFVWFDQYIAMFSSADFWEYFKNTLIYSFGSLIVSIGIGLFFALSINKIKNNWTRTTFSTLILVAWAVPGAVNALMWRWILQGQFGILNKVLLDLNLIDQPIAWLTNSLLALASVTLVDAWARIPFAMIVLLAGLQSIPDRMYDAVKVDGATTLGGFQHITLPHLRSSLAIVGLINWMFSFRAFSIIFPLTGGGPGTATQVMATYIHQEGMQKFNQGYASALSMFLVIISLFMAIFYVVVVMKGIDEQ